MKLTISQVDAIEALSVGVQPKTRLVGDALVELGILSVVQREHVKHLSEDGVRRTMRSFYSLTAIGWHYVRTIDVHRARVHSSSERARSKR